MKFNIGEKVQTPDGAGTVADVFSSKQGLPSIYSVEFTVEGEPFAVLYREDQVSQYVQPRPAEEDSIHIDGIEIRAECEDNVVIVIISANGEEISRGHGHVIHAGDKGIIQAFSWAAKKAWDALDETPHCRSTYRLNDYRRF